MFFLFELTLGQVKKRLMSSDMCRARWMFGEPLSILTYLVNANFIKTSALVRSADLTVLKHNIYGDDKTGYKL